MNENDGKNDDAHGGSPNPNLTLATGKNPPDTHLLSDIETPTKIIQQKVQVKVNRSSTNNSPLRVKALLVASLEAYQKVDPTFSLLPIETDSTASVLTKASEIPSDERNLKKYVTEPKNSPGNHTTMKPVEFFIRISSSQSIGSMKKDNGLFRWLQENRVWFTPYKFETTYDAVSAGFISHMSTTLHYRDQVNDIIQEVLKETVPQIEIQLVPTTMRYGKDHDKRTVQAVQYQADRKFVHAAREAIVKAFQTKKNELPRDIFFVPSPVNGSIDSDLYYKLLSQHHQKMSDIRSFAIVNVPNLSEKIIVQGEGNEPSSVESTLEKVILTGKVPGSQTLIFSSIEKTNYTNSEGRFLLITDKHKMKSAEFFIDDLIKYIHSVDQLKTQFSYNDEPIQRANRIKTSPQFSGYTQFLLEKSKIPTEITTNPPPNFWKNRQQLARVDYTSTEYDTNEPNKKARTAPETNDTATTGEMTESFGVPVDIDEVIAEERVHVESKLNDLKNELKTSFDEALRRMRNEMTTQLMATVSESEKRMTANLDSHMKHMIDQSNQAVSRIEEKSNFALDQITALLSSTNNTATSSPPRKSARHHSDKDTKKDGMEIDHPKQSNKSSNAARVSQSQVGKEPSVGEDT
jgi:hypothetical protein